MSDDGAEAAVPEVRAGQRIAKVMARAGVCSRREAEAWIAAGRVTVNGETLASPAFNVSEADDVRVDGKPLAGPERTRLFLFHKPKGLVTTARDPEGRPTVFAALPSDLPRLIAVGRLDINTEGLLLLTNDGGLARVLELPSTGWLRRYRVRAHGSIDQAALDRLAGGIAIGGVDYQGVEARLDREQGANAWLTLGLREGKNREIKVILEHLGLAVNRLIRVSFGPFELADLAEGEVVEVRTRVLKDQLGVKLAREASANFDAPLTVRGGEPPAPSQGDRAALRKAPSEGRGRPGRGAHGAEPDRAPRRVLPKPSTPERRRKHVSALRAEIAADASSAKGPRARVERGATQDRKGRTVAVERRSREPDAETGRRGREPPQRSRRPAPFEAQAAHGKGRGGAPYRGATPRRGGFKPDGERSGGPMGGKPNGRKDEPSSRREGARRFKPREGLAGDPGEGRRDHQREGRRSGADRGASAKPSRPGFGKPNGWKNEPSSRREGERRFKPREGFARDPGEGRRDRRDGGRSGADRGARTKPAGPGGGKGPPSGRGPRRPPRKR